MHKVIAQFFDLQDGNREYLPGDTFPREGLKVSAARLEELASSKNRCGVPVIEAVEEQEQKQTRKRVKKDAD